MRSLAAIYRAARWIVPITVCIGIGGWLALPSVSWDGSFPLYFDFLVVDGATLAGVPGATIEVVRDGPPRTQNANATRAFVFTGDSGGNVRAYVSLPAGGSTHGLWRSGRVICTGIPLHVSAPGYVDRVVMVSDFAGLRRSIRDANRISTTIELVRID